MTATVRPLTRAEIASRDFLPLLWEAAGVDADALAWIRDVDLPKLQVVGAVGDRLLGFAAFGPDGARTELHYIAVADDARGSGLGSRLVDAARRADTTLPLYASTDDDAVDFYRRLGFTVSSAPRDPRWPTRQRYDCTIAPLGDAADLTLAAYRAHALRYAQRTPETPSPLVDDLVGLVPAGSSVLELGCGTGRDADALEAAGLTVDRTDAAAPFVALQHAAGHPARVLDARDADYGGPYDAVFASAVLLHVPRARLRGVLRRARGATRAGGVIAASFKEGDGEYWSDRKLDAPRHFVLWRADDLTEAFTAAGWSEVSTHREPAGDDGEDWIAVTARNRDSR